MMPGIDISVVSPVFNGKDTIEEYMLRAVNTLNLLNLSYQIILLDDGSKDESLTLMREKLKKQPEIMIIKLKKNYGQSNAIAAGLTWAEGEYIVIMDSDLQDRPEDISELYSKIRLTGKDMIIATREQNNGVLWRNIFSSLFHFLTRLLTSLRFPNRAGVFRIMNRKCIEQLDEALQTPGTVLSYIHANRYSWGTIPLPREVRKPRKSNYTFKAMWHLALSRILPYSFMVKLLGSNCLKKYIPEFTIEEIYRET